MIGGQDIVIPTAAGACALDVCLRIIRRQWPQAVFEDALTGTVYEDYESIPVGRIQEIFAYQTKDAAKAWEDSGAVPQLANSMVQVLLTKESLTLVVDDRSAPAIAGMIESIRSAVRMRRAA